MNVRLSPVIVLLGWAGLCFAQAAPAPVPPPAAKPATTLAPMDEAKLKDWQARWDKNITGDSRNRYCDKANGEDIGWLMTPFLDGYYYGYLATKDPKWVDMLVDWADAWIKRAVPEPDGFPGWPEPKAAGTDVDKLDDWNADSLLGEAMALRPIVLLSGEILKTPALKDKYGAKAQSYLQLAERIYAKWDQRGAWRATKDGGMISIVLPYGLEAKAGPWAPGFDKRNDPGNGFSHPNNKANHVARWLLALADVTGKPTYRDRAEQWFKVLKSRLKAKDDGTFQIWNYWEPAGPWDYKPNGATKHWVGVHPRTGYYEIDLEGITDAYAHGLVFTRADLDRLIATALATKRYWAALVPYHRAIQQQVEEGLKPDSWGGLAETPRLLMLQARLRDAGK